MINKKQKEIINVLKNHTSESTAVTAEQMGIKGSDMRYYVHDLRKRGYPICSSNQGYWWGSDLGDVKKVMANLESRAYTILDAAYGLGEYIKGANK